MSGQTIKDVVIKIAIESSMSAAVDGLKKFAADGSVQLKQLAADLEKVRQLQAATMRGGGITGNSSGAAPALAASSQTTASAIDSNAGYRESAKNAAIGAAEFAKGLMLIVASGDKADEAMLRNVVSMQGYFNLLSGGIGTLNSFSAAMKARGAANAAGSASGSAESGGGSGVPAVVSGGGMKMLMNPYVLLAAACVGTALAIRGLGVAAMNEEIRRKASETRFTAIQEEHANAAVGRHADQSLRLSNSIPNYRGMMQGTYNQQGRSETEADIRREQP